MRFGVVEAVAQYYRMQGRKGSGENRTARFLRQSSCARRPPFHPCSMRLQLLRRFLTSGLLSLELRCGGYIRSYAVIRERIRSSTHFKGDNMALGFSRLTALLALCSLSGSLAQLSGSVGPTSSLSSKQGTICNVLNYGGSVGSSVCLSRLWHIVFSLTDILYRISDLLLVKHSATVSPRPPTVLPSTYPPVTTTCRPGKH